MRKFKYVGEEGKITAFGIEFKTGEYSEVESEFVAGKLANNRFFKELSADVDTVEFTEETKKPAKGK